MIILMVIGCSLMLLGGLMPLTLDFNPRNCFIHIFFIVTGLLFLSFYNELVAIILCYYVYSMIKVIIDKSDTLWEIN